MTVALEKYRALCHPDWLQDGDKIFKEAEESADQIMKSGKSRGAALLEQKLVDLSKAWENVKCQLVFQRWSLEFQVLQTQLDSHLDDGLHELDGLDFLGPLENLLQQEQSYRVSGSVHIELKSNFKMLKKENDVIITCVRTTTLL